MTAKINVKSDIKKSIRFLNKMQRRQIPFATSVALNKTADAIKRDEQRQMRRDLDNPTPSVIKSIRVKRSSKRALDAAVFILPAIDRFMRYQVEGGNRRPRGKAEAVPVRARLNQYGNVPGRRQGKINKLIAKQNVFVGVVRGVAGVWQRGKGRTARTRLTLLFAFERSVDYQPRFKFYKHAARALARTWPRAFNVALNRALRSAR